MMMLFDDDALIIDGMEFYSNFTLYPSKRMKHLIERSNFKSISFIFIDF